MRRALEVCQSAGVSVVFHPVKSMRPLRMMGYFCWEDKKIDIATRSRSPFQTFVHEFCHLEQALAGLWISQKDARRWDLFNRFIAGEVTPHPARLEECVRTIQACERDAERRVLHYAKSLGFPTVDLERYTRGANLYVCAYEAARRTGKWYKRSMYRSPEMMALVSGDRLRCDLGALPRGFLDKYLSLC